MASSTDKTEQRMDPTNVKRNDREFGSNPAEPNKSKIIDPDDIVVIEGLYFKEERKLYSYLYNSFNHFFDESIPTFLERREHTFFENTTETTEIKYSFKYSDVAIRPPVIEDDDKPLFPYDARMRNLTYSGKLEATVTQLQTITDIMTDKVTVNVVGSVEHNVPIAHIPIMIKSNYCNLNIHKNVDKNECKYDPGGYFIVNGSERVVIPLERARDNNPMVFPKKNSSSILYQAKVTSKSQGVDEMSQMITIQLKKDKNITIVVPILAEIPIFILFRALGIESDGDIIGYTVYDENDEAMINEIIMALNNSKTDKGKRILTRDDAIEFLTTKIRVTKRYSETDEAVKQIQKRRHLLSLLQNNFLPHIEGSTLKKAQYLGYMINRLLKCSMGREPADNRDIYVNKTIDLPGKLFYDLFKQYHKKMLNDCQKSFKKRNIDDKKPFNIINQIKPNVIEMGIKGSLSTGNWGNKKGVAQVLQRLTYTKTISTLRRINSPAGDLSSIKLTGPRHVDPSQLFGICPVETPEGQKTGLVKHMSLIGNITIAKSSQIGIIKKFLKNKMINTNDVSSFELIKYAKIFLNGEWLGISDRPYDLWSAMKNMKYHGKFDATTSITQNIEQNEIKIFCNGGRLFRPVLRVENNVLLLNKDHISRISTESSTNPTKIASWNEFMAKYPGIIEYLDVDETTEAMVSMYPHDVEKMRLRMIESAKKIETMKDIRTSVTLNRYNDMTFVRYTHCEIHPALMTGIITANVPFYNHNQGPRNTYQFNMTTACMGIYATNYRKRIDQGYILYNPQRPIVSTRHAKYTNLNKLANGENVIVALQCYTGCNQEDSIIMNQTSIDRGLFRAMHIQKKISQLRKNHSTSKDDEFIKPDPSKVSGMSHGMYDKLTEKAYVPEETTVVNGDMVIGKVSPILPTGTSGYEYKDNSEMYKTLAPGVVDRVYTGIFDNDGYEVRKMLIRSERVPGIGDKFCCYSRDHEVLTIEGWVKISQLSKYHKVATLSPNHCLEYQKPTHLQKYEYDGQMFKVCTDNINLMVTPNHNMYVANNNSDKYIEERADTSSNYSRKYKKNIKTYECERPVTKFILPAYNEESFDIKYNMDDWLIFSGLWSIWGKLCDGIVRFDIHIVPTKNVLADCCDRMNLDLKRDMSINNIQLVAYLQQKNLPKVDSLSKRQTKLLIDTITLEDNYLPFKSNESNFVDWIQILCLHAGLACNIIQHQNGEIIAHIIKNKTELQPIVRKENWRLKNYSGHVYCCTVPNGVIYVRRHGIPVWCCNSRHGQKGIVGLTLSQSEMPYTKDGIVPDIIMNPTGLPSRMTMGQPLECLLGKLGAIMGHEVDGTAFNNYDFESMKDMLEKEGYQRSGYEELTSGITGKKIKTLIFIGPTYYQRIKHMVADKIHARARGPRVSLTRQPVEGRARDGGFRLGEMERDCLISHGMAKFLKERLVDTSDAYGTYVCDDCGLFAQRKKRKDDSEYASRKDLYHCPACKNTTKISKIIIPYAFKLFVQELMSMCIAPRIRVKKNKYSAGNL